MSEGEGKVADTSSSAIESSEGIVSQVAPPTNLSTSPQTSSANSWKQNYNKMNRAQRNTARKGLNNKNTNKNAKLAYLNELNKADPSKAAESTAEPTIPTTPSITPRNGNVSNPVSVSGSAANSAVNASTKASANGPKTYVCGCLKPKNPGNSQKIIDGIQTLGTTLGGTRHKRNKRIKHNKSCKHNKSHKHSKHNKSCKKSKRSKRRKSMRNRR